MSAAHHVHNRSGKQRDRERGYSIKNYQDEPAKKTVWIISAGPGPRSKNGLPRMVAGIMTQPITTASRNRLNSRSCKQYPTAKQSKGNNSRTTAGTPNSKIFVRLTGSCLYI